MKHMKHIDETHEVYIETYETYGCKRLVDVELNASVELNAMECRGGLRCKAHQRQGLSSGSSRRMGASLGEMPIPAEAR
jgi:hypothetical protein